MSELSSLFDPEIDDAPDCTGCTSRDCIDCLSIKPFSCSYETAERLVEETEEGTWEGCPYCGHKVIPEYGEYGHIGFTKPEYYNHPDCWNAQYWEEIVLCPRCKRVWHFENSSC